MMSVWPTLSPAEAGSALVLAAAPRLAAGATILGRLRRLALRNRNVVRLYSLDLLFDCLGQGVSGYEVSSLRDLSPFLE
jgi:hypothetical protein